MKIGLYFGSFNPIHHGHLIIARHLLNETDLAQVWFVVSPHNPFKQQKQLLNAYDRLHMVQLAVEKDPTMKAVDIEFRLPQPSYTINTLTYLEEKYPLHEFVLILGGDSYQNLPKWKNAAQIIERYPLYVYRRPGVELPPLFGHTTLLDAPLLDISATHIRNLVKRGKSIAFLVPESVEKEIVENQYYRS